MSDAIYPTLSGLTWDITRTPQFSTQIQRSVNGYERRAAFYATPIWHFQLHYEFLSESDYGTLAAFWAARQGGFDSFLWADSEDSSATIMPFGVGDGVSLDFQLQRTLSPTPDSTKLYGADGSSFEPVYNLNGSPTVYWTIGGVPYLILSGMTNYLHYSSDLTQAAAWTATPAITPTYSSGGTAPVGTGITRLQAPSSSGIISQTFDVSTNSGDYVASVWIKDNGSTGAPHLSLTISNLTQAESFSALITPTGTWTRHDVGLSNVQAGDSIKVIIQGGFAGASLDIYAWNVQLEKGLYPTRNVVTSSGPGSATNWTVSATGLVSFQNVLSVVPANGVVISWSGSYYWRVRFAADSLDFNEFMYQLHELKQVDLVRVRP